jgi:hypothetical protein
MGAGFLHLFLFLGFSVFHLSSRDEITAFAELQQVRAGCAILPTVEEHRAPLDSEQSTREDCGGQT